MEWSERFQDKILQKTCHFEEGLVMVCLGISFNKKNQARCSSGQIFGRISIPKGLYTIKNYGKDFIWIIPILISTEKFESFLNKTYISYALVSQQFGLKLHRTLVGRVWKMQDRDKCHTITCRCFISRMGADTLSKKPAFNQQYATSIFKCNKIKMRTYRY